MIIENLIKNSKLKMSWDMDGFHESVYAVPFAVYLAPTKAYKLCISERAIWANEIPILECKGVYVENINMILQMIKNSLLKSESLMEIPLPKELYGNI